MVLQEYRSLYRIAVYVMMISSLVQAVPLMASLVVESRTFSPMAATFSIVCNALGGIASLFFSWAQAASMLRTERHIVTWKRLFITACVASVFIATYILSLISAFHIIFFPNDALLENRIIYIYVFSTVCPFWMAIFSLICDEKEQQQWEQWEQFLEDSREVYKVKEA
jgi:hypothetical protein